MGLSKSSFFGDDPTLDLKATVDAGKRSAARVTVADRSRGAEDCRFLLDVLGLLPEVADDGGLRLSG